MLPSFACAATSRTEKRAGRRGEFSERRLHVRKGIVVWVQQFKDREHLMLQWIDPDNGRKSKSAETADPDAAEKARADQEYELNHGISRNRPG